MSAIKEIYDLSVDLKNSITDTKQLQIIMSILDKINNIEREHLELERSQFESERKHHQEATDLKAFHSEEMAKIHHEHSATVSKLEIKISELKSELELKSKPSEPFSVGRA